MEEPLLSAHVEDVERGPQLDSKDNAESIWDVMTFRSITSVMNHGIVKQLDFEDLLCLPGDMDPAFCHNVLSSCWQDEEGRPEPFLLKAIFYAYGWPYLRLGVLKVFNDGLGFVGPLLLNRLIHFLQQGVLHSPYPYTSSNSCIMKSLLLSSCVCLRTFFNRRRLYFCYNFHSSGSPHWDGLLLALSLGLTSVLKSFLDTQYSFRLAKLKLKLRSSIMTIIYNKCLCLTLAAQSRFSEGEIQTFMSVDADRTVNLCNSFHDIWSLPLQIGVALYLLYTQVRFAFLAGLAITILLIPVNKWISELIANATEKMMKQKDERVRRTGEILSHIRTLKMYGWEQLFSKWVMETRNLEVKHLATRKYLDAWCVFFWAATPTLFSLCTFGLFSLMGYQLDAATAFISTRRLSRFLRCSVSKHEENVISPGDGSNIIPKDMAAVMNDACCAWSSSDDKLESTVLNHMNLSLPKGAVIAVIGEVGSGKSSLLCAILGEMKLIKGSIHSSGSVAYVPQVPWILAGTIRDNILFGRNYDSERYLNTIKVCALDIDISLMAGGDMAYIGEQGVNLSGGQRARLALARAIYQGSDLYLLDDVLSAVDAHVARWILQNAILGPLMSQTTRILCTHNVQAISSADLVIVLDKGEVRWTGSSVDLVASSHSSFFQQNEFDAMCSGQQELVLDNSIHGRENKEHTHSTEVVEEIIEEEQRKEGRVEISVYKNYASYAGWFVTIVICLSAILMQATRNGNDLWLSYWVDTTGTSQKGFSTSFYLVVLSIFCAANSFLTLVRAFSFAFGGLQAAVQVHNRLLDKLIDAPVQFFVQTPSGRILNRFSSDLYTIDDSLPFMLNILVANFVGLLGIAVVLSYVQVFFLLLVLPFWLIYSKLQFFYRSTSRELRRLDSVSRSPIYATFTETLKGSSTIRAFKSEEFFQHKFTEHVTLYQRTSYSETIASLWLSLRLQLIGAFIVTFVAVMAVAGSRSYLPVDFGTPGLVGLALSYASPIVSLLGNFLTSFAETEKELVSVERALEYMDIPQEVVEESKAQDPHWPIRGMIEYKNVTMRYMPTLPPALRDVTFTIAGGTQVGIIGRTGAGKSSILNALFRLSPVSSGYILVDGLNIVDVPVRDLRSRLAVVPQSPFLFQGSLRDNLDPLGKSNDTTMWEILEKCHVKGEVEAAGGLDIHVQESGTSFSVGQRQLLCLARALLKSSKVLCLDECTANVDAQTARLLQNTISSGCRGMTVVTIAHRISTVLDMDDILILEQGKLVEKGNPQALLADPSSKFSSFAKASTM
ncbi:unnamed protein product [Linum tenue]|uniref:ABC-type xenobiotic transporter n=1 Tax=Linum tenue TaxID=586396 RepID=A0AAV0KEI2_9ROSI|nr:unnamed protein product [Linum tenue]